MNAWYWPIAAREFRPSTPSARPGREAEVVERGLDPAVLLALVAVDLRRPLPDHPALLDHDAPLLLVGDGAADGAAEQAADEGLGAVRGGALGRSQRKRRREGAGENVSVEHGQTPRRNYSRSAQKVLTKSYPILARATKRNR